MKTLIFLFLRFGLAAIFIFFLFSILPGDPASVILGKYATQTQIIELRHELQLDEPIFMQLFSFFKNIITFNFKNSLLTHEPVLEMIFHASQISFSFLFPGFFTACILALILAGVTLFFHDKKVAHFIKNIQLILICIPSLFLIVTGQLLFCYIWNIFPICGLDDDFLGTFQSLIFPYLLFVLLNVAYQYQIFLPILEKESKEPYILALKARGFLFRRIFFNHIIRTTFPVLMQYTLNELPSIFLSGILIESFFALPGLGSLVIDSIQNADIPVMQTITLFSAAFSIFCTAIADTWTHLFDPRIKKETIL